MSSLGDESCVLLVGGYGVVGRYIASLLAADLSERLIVAGRSLRKAERVAIHLGATARQFDVLDDEPSLDGVGVVVVCVEQPDASFARRCFERGVHYVDISASHTFLRSVEELEEVARAHGSTALLSVGVCPGLTNLLAAEACGCLPNVERIDILVELGLGDTHGTAAVEWMLDNAAAQFEAEGEGRVVRSFGERCFFALPGEEPRSAYRFDFSDQHVVPRTLGVPRVSSWLRFSSASFTWLVALVARWPFTALLRVRGFRRVMLWLVRRARGSDRCVAAVRARSHGAHTHTTAIVGSNEALMTAIVTAHATRHLMMGKCDAGVFHLEQVLTLDSVLPDLEARVPHLERTQART